MQHLVERHSSPDGLLTLRVERDDDGDMSIGFEGFPWHTHADILAYESGLSEEDAVRHFVLDLLGNRRIVAVARVQGQVTDIWVADKPVPDKYKPAEETIEFRYWDGRSVVGSVNHGV